MDNLGNTDLDALSNEILRDKAAEIAPVMVSQDSSSKKQLFCVERKIIVDNEETEWDVTQCSDKTVDILINLPFESATNVFDTTCDIDLSFVEEDDMN